MLKDVLFSIAQKTNLDQHSDKFREALVPKSTADDGLSLRNVVTLLVRSGISVRVSNESETRIEEVRLRDAH